MTIRLRRALQEHRGELRYEPTPKRVRALLGGQVAVDSRRAALVWEPRRIVPTYAVPLEDVLAEVVDVEAGPDRLTEFAGRPVWDPGVPFAVRETPGEPVELRAAGARAAAFRLTVPELPSYLVLDLGAVDEWYEEDQLLRGHPHDPYHRVDYLPSSRTVRVELDGNVLADSSRPVLVVETLLPPRWYLPREDVRVRLEPSPTTSYCAYKGPASYWCFEVGGARHDDLAWGYEHPLHEAELLTGRVAFLQERLEVTVDGQSLRPGRS